MQASEWGRQGQPIGPLWEQTPALVEAVVTIAAEWGRLQAEAAERRGS